MNQRVEPSREKTLAAVCGLFCGACQVYIASTEDPARLTRLATRMQMSEEALRCRGCRSDKRWPACENCAMFTCAASKGIDFCSECSDYPCDDLRKFQAGMPHRLDLWKDLDRIKAVGWEAWLDEVIERYACPECATINSAYDQSCRSCGAVPSCSYVAEHGETVQAFLSAPRTGVAMVAKESRE